jgi:glycine hydroxymethyltransferase
METIVGYIDEAITNFQDDAKLEAIAEKVNDMMSSKPLFTH